MVLIPLTQACVYKANVCAPHLCFVLRSFKLSPQHVFENSSLPD